VFDQDEPLVEVEAEFDVSDPTLAEDGKDGACEEASPH